MDKILKKECINRFGQKGIALFRAIEEIHHKDFCVEPGSHPYEIRIGIGFRSRKIIFEFSEDYSQLIFPDGNQRLIKELKYTDIRKYLPMLSM